MQAHKPLDTVREDISELKEDIKQEIMVSIVIIVVEILSIHNMGHIPAVPVSGLH